MTALAFVVIEENPREPNSRAVVLGMVERSRVRRRARRLLTRTASAPVTGGRCRTGAVRSCRRSAAGGPGPRWARADGARLLHRGVERLAAAVGLGAHGAARGGPGRGVGGIALPRGGRGDRPGAQGRAAGAP